MTIAPIRHMVSLVAPPDRAFELFARRITDWWPPGRSPGPTPHVAIVIEPFTNGRWFERDADGVETLWGKVLDWSPPSRLLLGWQLAWRPDTTFAYDADLVTEVELTFVPGEAGGTVVTLEHRDLERLGSDVAVTRIGGGWSARIEEFRLFADAVHHGVPFQRPPIRKGECG